ncbi:hypothetical protein E2C01_029321 [Portunus trituberculatus]|uniref:Uncharacterized protein n=1 Tax=Portunus trituberculatus TaxID=210409 RepID=A0A5B7EUB5_PORTR|nr:hypothetical protein [Portunus trituberculatus]
METHGERHSRHDVALQICSCSPALSVLDGCVSSRVVEAFVAKVSGMDAEFHRKISEVQEEFRVRISYLQAEFCREIWGHERGTGLAVTLPCKVMQGRRSSKWCLLA